jgi:hypothetical protein
LSSVGPIQNPEGSRSNIGALLLGYYIDDGRLHYAGRAGTGMTEKELKRLTGVLLAPLQVPKMPLAEPHRVKPLWFFTEAVQSALGAPGGGRGSDLPDLDRGQPPAAGLLSSAA